MKIAFSQVYLHQDAQLPFSVHFQRLLTQLVSDSVDAPSAFRSKYGETYVGFNVSAKQKQETEIRGPSVSAKYSVVEFTIFLPHPVIVQHADMVRTTVRLLLDAVLTVLHDLGFNTARLEAAYDTIVQTMATAPHMIKGT